MLIIHRASSEDSYNYRTTNGFVLVGCTLPLLIFSLWVLLQLNASNFARAADSGSLAVFICLVFFCSIGFTASLLFVLRASVTLVGDEIRFKHGLNRVTTYHSQDIVYFSKRSGGGNSFRNQSSPGRYLVIKFRNGRQETINAFISGYDELTDRLEELVPAEAKYSQKL